MSSNSPSSSQMSASFPDDVSHSGPAHSDSAYSDRSTPGPVSPSPWSPEVQAQQDSSHLQMLSFSYYLMGGFCALLSMLPVVHLVVGLSFVFMPEPMVQADGGDEITLAMRGFGLLFAALGSLAIFIGLTFSACLVATGRKLAQRQSHTFCTVMAACSCVFMPFGTILGILTLIVLQRPSVQATFRSTQAAQAVPTPDLPS